MTDLIPKKLSRQLGAQQYKLHNKKVHIYRSGWGDDPAWTIEFYDNKDWSWVPTPYKAKFESKDEEKIRQLGLAHLGMADNTPAYRQIYPGELTSGPIRYHNRGVRIEYFTGNSTYVIWYSTFENGRWVETNYNTGTTAFEDVVVQWAEHFLNEERPRPVDLVRPVKPKTEQRHFHCSDPVSSAQYPYYISPPCHI